VQQDDDVGDQGGSEHLPIIPQPNAPVSLGLSLITGTDGDGYAQPVPIDSDEMDDYIINIIKKIATAIATSQRHQASQKLELCLLFWVGWCRTDRQIRKQRKSINSQGEN